MKVRMLRLVLVCLLVSLFAVMLAPLAAEAHGSGLLPDDVRYIALGDSVSAGWGAPMVNGMRVNGYVSQLHRQLLMRGRSELNNLGIPGLTSGQFLFLLEHWPEASEAVQKADLITLSIGGNDIIWTDHQAPGDAAKMREALQKYESNIQTILDKLRALNPDARLFVLEVYNPFPEDDDRHAALSEWVSWVNESVAAAANRHDSDVVPVASLFQKHEKDYVNLSNNDIHPNLVGHTKIAEQISHVLFGNFVPLVVEPEMQPNLLWNGKPKKLKVPLIYENDTVYVEADQVAELYGGLLHSIRYRLGAWWMRVNGKRVTLTSPILMKDGHPYLPLRAVSETLGVKVFWVEESQTICVVMRGKNVS
jgi:lysophospholipase L1-like esterase